MTNLVLKYTYCRDGVLDSKWSFPEASSRDREDNGRWSLPPNS